MTHETATAHNLHNSSDIPTPPDSWVTNITSDKILWRRRKKTHIFVKI